MPDALCYTVLGCGHGGRLRSVYNALSDLGSRIWTEIEFAPPVRPRQKGVAPGWTGKAHQLARSSAEYGSNGSPGLRLPCSGGVLLPRVRLPEYGRGGLCASSAPPSVRLPDDASLVKNFSVEVSNVW